MDNATQNAAGERVKPACPGHDGGMVSTHVKHDARPHALGFEAAALRWLAEPGDGAPVVAVLNYDELRAGGPGAGGAGSGERGAARSVLLEPKLRPASPDVAAAEAFGRLLAHTHAAGAPWFGAPPAGWMRDGVMGRERLPLRVEESNDSWGAFYAADRLLPYVAAARANGSMDADDERILRRLAERLKSGALEHSQPELVVKRAAAATSGPDASATSGPGASASPAARIHGDLWGGNILWTRDSDVLHHTSGLAFARAAAEKHDAAGSGVAGSGVVGVLIDPAAHGGHAESDLAQLFVFGAPHVERIVAAYNEASPLDGGIKGFQQRRGLHQLHILVVHAAIFGGSYGRETINVARGYL